MVRRGILGVQVLDDGDATEPQGYRDSAINVFSPRCPGLLSALRGGRGYQFYSKSFVRAARGSNPQPTDRKAGLSLSIDYFADGVALSDSPGDNADYKCNCAIVHGQRTTMALATWIVNEYVKSYNIFNVDYKVWVMLQPIKQRIPFCYHNATRHCYWPSLFKQHLLCR